jgi:hypothetical protein
MTNEGFHLFENKVCTQSTLQGGDECSTTSAQEQIHFFVKNTCQISNTILLLLSRDMSPSLLKNIGD